MRGGVLRLATHYSIGAVIRRKTYPLGTGERQIASRAPSGRPLRVSESDSARLEIVICHCENPSSEGMVCEEAEGRR